jgi:hypothetical protein
MFDRGRGGAYTCAHCVFEVTQNLMFTRKTQRETERFFCRVHRSRTCVSDGNWQEGILRAFS